MWDQAGSSHRTSAKAREGGEVGRRRLRSAGEGPGDWEDQQERVLRVEGLGDRHGHHHQLQPDGPGRRGEQEGQLHRPDGGAPALGSPHSDTLRQQEVPPTRGEDQSPHFRGDQDSVLSNPVC